MWTYNLCYHTGLKNDHFQVQVVLELDTEWKQLPFCLGFNRETNVFTTKVENPKLLSKQSRTKILYPLISKDIFWVTFCRECIYQVLDEGMFLGGDIWWFSHVVVLFPMPKILGLGFIFQLNWINNKFLRGKIASPDRLSSSWWNVTKKILLQILIFLIYYKILIVYLNI